MSELTDTDKARINKAVDAAVEDYGPVLEALTDQDVRLRMAVEAEDAALSVCETGKLQDYNKARDDILEILESERIDDGCGHGMCDYDSLKTKIEAMPNRPLPGKNPIQSGLELCKEVEAMRDK